MLSQKFPIPFPRPAPQPTHTCFLAQAFPCNGAYRVADPFSSLGAFSSFSIWGPVIHCIDDCDHLLLYLPGTGIASYKTAISKTLQQNLPGICKVFYGISIYVQLKIAFPAVSMLHPTDQLFSLHRIEI